MYKSLTFYSKSLITFFIGLFYLLTIISEVSVSFAEDPLVLSQSPQNLTLSIQHDISIEIEEIGPESSIEYLNLDSFYVPEDLGDYQRVLNFSTNKKEVLNILEKNSILYYRYQFEENDITSNTIQISSNYKLRSQPHFPKIYSKQKYPIVERSESQFIPYLEFSDKINTNDALQQKAFELAQGEDDVYIIASKIANWVQQEIEYDLSTIFENPEQSATEVLESREGVCTELSIIFVSMMRTLGIPTKITTGYAYTNSEEIIDLVGSNWGGHAWTEIYINGEWVPFDLTYEQYGFIDSSHLIFQQNSDLEELGVQVEMSTYNYDIVPNSLQTAFNFNIESINELSSSFENIESSLEINRKVVSSGSHILVEVTIENPQNYYQTVPFDLIFPENMEAKTPTSHILSLKPNDERTIQYILQMPENMNGYSFPVVLYTRTNEINKVKITTSTNANFYTYDELHQQLNSDNSYNTTNNSYKNRVNILNNVNDSTNNQTINTSLELEDIDYNSICEFIKESSEFYLTCNISQFSKNDNVLSLDLCSVQNCETVVFSEDTRANKIKIKAIKNPTFSIGVKNRGIYEEETFNIKIPEPDDLNLTYEEGEEYLDVKSHMNGEIFHEIEVEVQNQKFRLDNEQKRQVINLEPGNYTMKITQHHFNEEVNSQNVDIQIKESNSFFQRIISIFKSLLPF